MKSQANIETRLDCELNSARSTASRHAVTVLLIFTVGGGFVVEVLGARRAEATPLTAIVEVPQVPASAARPAAAGPRAAPTVLAPHPMAAAASPLDPGAAAIPAGDWTAQLLLPTNASAELRGLARGAIAGQANAEHDLGTFFALGIEVRISSAPPIGIVAPPIKA